MSHPRGADRSTERHIWIRPPEIEGRLSTSWGLDATPRTCLDHVFQELTPAGVPVWTWDTSAHIPVSETAPEWVAEQVHDVANGVYDPYHYNSIEPTGDGFMFSFRHLDAVYRISTPTDDTGLTGPIHWKLGGTARAESLTIQNDPSGGPSGQHDARLLPDGSVTIHDNGTLGLGPGRQPRAVRYVIDTQAKTATFAGQLTDPEVTSSGCCGSARLLPSGDIVTGWGGTPQISEYAPDGTRLFRISGTFVYRGTPIQLSQFPGQFTAQQFRDGTRSSPPGRQHSRLRRPPTLGTRRWRPRCTRSSAACGVDLTSGH